MTYSEGKLNADDEGDLTMLVTHEKGVVRVDFGKPVAWLGFPPAQAIAFAELLKKHAQELTH